MQFTRLVIRKSRLKKRTKETDVLIYYHHKSTFYWSTLVAIKPEDFIVKKGWIKPGIPNYDAFAKQIKERQQYIEDLIDKFRLKHQGLPTGEQLYKTEREDRMGIFQSGEFSLIRDFDNWRHGREDVSSGTKAIYTQTSQYLTLFLKSMVNDPDFKLTSLFNVDLNFFESFARFLSKRTSRSTKQSLSNSTINKQIVTLQNFLRAKRKRDKIKISDDIEDFEFNRSQGSREQLSDSDVEKILNVSPKVNEKISKGLIKPKRGKTLFTVLDMIRLNVDFGLRIKDLLTLKSNDVHIDEHDSYLEIPAIEKTEQPYKVPLLDVELIEVLKRYKNDDGQLFPEMSIVTFNKSLRYLAELAGITAIKEHHMYSLGKKVTVKKRRCDLLSSHSLRKTSINRNILTYGRDIAKVISQHKSESGFKAYVDYNDYSVIKERMKAIKKVSKNLPE